jgi:hypothetical protein
VDKERLRFYDGGCSAAKSIKEIKESKMHENEKTTSNRVLWLILLALVIGLLAATYQSSNVSKLDLPLAVILTFVLLRFFLRNQ